MSVSALIYPHMTREDRYHDALEAFIRTSAEYLDLEVPAGGLVDAPGTYTLATNAQDLC